MFAPQQEIDLGDIVAEATQSQLRPVDDAEISERLSEIGERVVRHLPSTGLSFRFYVSDAPVANAMSIVGGRVYLTRRIIGLFQNEDEMAGVIGHELGHIVTHQQANMYTRLFREQLGTNEVTDRKDIFEKYNRLLDEWREHSSIRIDPEAQQQEADRVGLEAAVRAGYSPQALADFWDRFTENKGKTGSWFSELFESTPPESKRYREMVKDIAALPSGCRDAAST
jgi:predicted Zn-dependent protease